MESTGIFLTFEFIFLFIGLMTTAVTNSAFNAFYSVNIYKILQEEKGLK